MKAISIIVPSWYVPKSEEGKESPTRFKLRGLTGMEFLAVHENAKERNGGYVLGTDAQKAALKYGLVGWEGLNDDKGPVEFSRIQDDNLARIPFDVIRELTNEVLARTELSGEDEKK